MRWGWVLTMLLTSSAPAFAQDDDQAPRFCPNRPSIGESACITEPGHVQLEVSAFDWTKQTDPDQRQDTVLIGDFQARFGLAPASELQVSWTPYGHVRTHDRLNGAIDRASRIGDVQIGFRQNLRHPDGSGFSFGIEPSVTLPVGREPVGAGTWAAGVVVPMTYDLSDKLNLALTNEVDAAADEDGHGRHFALSEVVGLGYDLTKQLTAVAEVQVQQDDDPSGHTAPILAAGSLAWQPRHGLQIDALVGAGLNRSAPDVRFLTGGAVLF